ncbi:MAG TPA: hypothetical protein VNI57_09835 [Candidatus Saccharimonadales bacterium]|nr:hypothetical protein [Candidatus Saccharimonadales bacterium]
MSAPLEIPGLDAPTGWIAAAGRRALMVGLAGAAACAVGAFLDPVQFFRSYLIAYAFWIGMPIGCLAILMLHHLSGGAWGLVIRRILESATRTFPVMALLFIPLLPGLKDLYVWARPEAVAADEILQHKAIYLNVPFFLVRAVIFFGSWILLSTLLNRWSRQQDSRPDTVDSLARFQRLSAPGLVIVVLTVTFASVDWLMSLEPHWFSTIYGALVLIEDTLAAFAFVIAVALWLSRRAPMAGALRAVHLHDLGKLLFAFVMMWGYFAFSQFLIIWAGNLPDEIPYYLRRLQGGWEWAGLAVVVGHFFLPFLFLLPRATKRNTRLLLRVALLLVLMSFFDTYWTTAGAFTERLLDVHWLDLAAPVALGGIWFFLMTRELQRRPLLPVGDPFLPEALAHEES